MSPGVLRLATRGSPLALWQAAAVADVLRAARPGTEVETIVVDTTGDRRQDRPVWELGGQGVFVKEVQAAVLEGRADAAVHSAKDLPSSTAPGLALAAIPFRADPRDVLVGARLADLGPGAPVATGSVRRRAQLAWARPDLTFTGLRGNIATRLQRVPDGGAIVMAAAALERLGIEPAVAEALDVAVMVPQVGQGAIAVECRAGDDATGELLASVDDPVLHIRVVAERAFLARLGGGCDLPVGAFCAAASGAGPAVLRAMVASLDGRVMLRTQRPLPAGATRAAAETAGTAAADELLDSGGRDLLAGSGMSA